MLKQMQRREPLDLAGQGALGAKCHNGDFGRAVKAKWKFDCADAAVDVKLKVTEAKPALDIFVAVRREVERRKERDANLAAVGMAAEHESDSLALGLHEQVVNEVRGMAEKNDWFVRNIPDRLRHGGGGIGYTANGIVETCQPESAAGALDGQV